MSYTYKCPLCGCPDFDVLTGSNGELCCVCDTCQYEAPEEEFQFEDNTKHTWNYRRMKYTTKYNETVIIITEVHYKNGVPEMHIINPYDQTLPAAVEPWGETPDELRRCYDIMFEAFEQPILEYVDGVYKIVDETIIEGD